MGVALLFGMSLSPALAIADEESMIDAASMAVDEDALGGVSTEQAADAPSEEPVEDSAQEPAAPIQPNEPIQPNQPIQPNEQIQPIEPAPVDQDVAPSAGVVPRTETPAGIESSELTSDASPMAVGADGGAAPYIYWDVRDSDTGQLVEGATFTLEYRYERPFLWWTTWEWAVGSPSGGAVDCAGACSSGSLDRDGDGGEFLLEHHTSRIASNRLAAGTNLRVTQQSAPEGYRWIVPGASRTIGGQNDNSAPWNGTTTHSFGTFHVEKIPLAPRCAAGYVYGISETGQIRQVSPNGSVADLGSRAPGVSSFNGLGIGPGGERVLAYERTSSSTAVTIWEYSTTAGTWASRGHSINSATNSRTVQFVAGGISLNNGRYYVGGFNSDGTAFRLWEYNPVSNTSTYKGHINTSPGSSNTNGDLAFDSLGNLFVVRGSGTTTTVFSVTAADLASANGSQIPTSTSSSVTTMSSVNGVAFDSSGKAFLGSSDILRSYSMPNWSSPTTIVSSGLNSTDLATCSSPPTITIEKYVENGRVTSTDQFAMTLRQGQTAIGSATTTGNSAGLQKERIGPLPTVRGVPLTFSETGAGTTNMSQYSSSYRCEVDGVQDHSASGNGTSGTITIPAGGQSVICRFHNSPLMAHVVITKQVTDAEGENPQPRRGWTVGAAAVATSGTAATTPASAMQQTDASGEAAWDIRFSSSAGRADVTVSEAQQAGYEFVAGQCTVTHLDGSTAVTELTGPGGQRLTGVRPGDSVDCTYVNKPMPGGLTIVKAFDESVPASVDMDFSGAYTCSLNGRDVAWGTWMSSGAGAAALTAGDGSPAPNAIPAGAECAVTENPPEGGLPNSSYVWGDDSATGPVVIASGQTSTVTVTNTVDRLYGSFTVTKAVSGEADEGLTYSGDWQCELGEETVTGRWGPIADGGIWTSPGSVPLGASCSVTGEDRPTDPVDGDPSYRWDGDPDLGQPVLAGDDDALITVTNTTVRELGAVTWTKVDDSAVLLGGSEWALEGPALFNGGEPLAIEDCESSPCSGADRDPEPGSLLIEDLAWGEYTLTETKAPAGHRLSADGIDFTIGAGTLQVALGPLANPRLDGPNLPLTGGLGRDFYAIAGTGLLILGSGAVGAVQLRKRRREATESV